MTSLSTQPLLETMRSATWSRHTRFENLPFVTALVDGSLPLESYIGQLRGLAVIVGTLENSISTAEGPLFSRIRPLLTSRFAMLCSDLAYFAPRCVPDVKPAISAALEISRMIREAGMFGADTLAGYLYVLEGTTRGNQVHLPDIRRCFDLQDEKGVAFYTGYGAATDEHWEEFRLAMNAEHSVDEAVMLQAVEQMYSGLERFHNLLFPVAAEAIGFTATSLNPEAGDHPVPQDPAILCAALRAGQRCWDEFSYYRRRYGDRGRRFTDSDVAWLAALVGKSEEVILDQVLWLGRVLAARGMPRIMLERQLVLLGEELSSADTDTMSLNSATTTLAQERQNLLPAGTFETLCTSLGTLLTSTTDHFPDLPVILAAACVDTLAGIPECAASLQSWLEESAIITPDEREQIERILSAPRTSISSEV